MQPGAFIVGSADGNDSRQEGSILDRRRRTRVRGRLLRRERRARARAAAGTGVLAGNLRRRAVHARRLHSTRAREGPAVGFRPPRAAERRRRGGALVRRPGQEGVGLIGIRFSSVTVSARSLPLAPFASLDIACQFYATDA